MARKGQRNQKISGQFAARLVEMLEAPGYRAMSLSAHLALARIEIELAHHGGRDNGDLVVTFQNFEDYGIHRHAISPALRELVALGFVQVTEKGAAGNAGYRRANKFRLTFRPCGTAPGDGTHEWRRIKTIDDAIAAARAVRADMPERHRPLRSPLRTLVA